jgi:hypothetical protein
VHVGVAVRSQSGTADNLLAVFRLPAGCGWVLVTPLADQGAPLDGLALAAHVQRAGLDRRSDRFRSFGYAGFLTGPPTIGLLAEATTTSLRAALLLVCALCLLAALLSRRLTGRPTPR